MMAGHQAHPAVHHVLLLLLALAMAAVTHAALAPRIPSDMSQWVYTPQNVKAKDQKPMQRFWDRSVLEQSHMVENFAQMKHMLDKLNAGQPITVVAMGDSITANHGGCFQRNEEHRQRHVKLFDPQLTKYQCNGMLVPWITSFMQQINATWPHPDHLLINLAKPGSIFASWSDGECLEEYFPHQADLIIVEHLPALEHVNKTVLQAERMLHRFWLHMQAPLPAVILLNMYPCMKQSGNWGLFSSPDKCVRDIKQCPTECPTYFKDQPEPERMYVESELHTHAVASYYGLTSLSQTSFMHALMREGWPERMQNLSECEAFALIYSDGVHPDAHGRLVLADMLVNFLAMAQWHLDAMATVQTPGGSQWVHMLPARPMEPESVNLYRSRCLYSAAKVLDEAGSKSDLHTMHMLKAEGWSFVEYDGEAKKYKPGWVSSTPGSTLWIELPLSLVADASAMPVRRVTLEEGASEWVSERPVEPVQDFRWHLGKIARKLGAQALPTLEPESDWVQQVRLMELNGAQEAAVGAVSAADSRAGRTLKTGPGLHISLHVVFLRSYKHMGKAKLTCLESCQCKHDFNGHNPDYHNSIPEIAFVRVYAPDPNGRCTLEIKVLPETDSGEHKVKVINVALGTYVNMTHQISQVTMASRSLTVTPAL